MSEMWSLEIFQTASKHWVIAFSCFNTSVRDELKNIAFHSSNKSVKFLCVLVLSSPFLSLSLPVIYILCSFWNISHAIFKFWILKCPIKKWLIKYAWLWIFKPSFWGQLVQYWIMSKKEGDNSLSPRGPSYCHLPFWGCSTELRLKKKVIIAFWPNVIPIKTSRFFNRRW